MKRISPSSALTGASLIALVVASLPHAALAVPGAVVSLNTGATIASGSNVAITNATNPLLNTSNGTATSPTITYAGVGNAGMTIDGTIASTGANSGLYVYGNNSHGAADVTTGVNIAGSISAGGTGAAVYYTTTGQYNFLTVNNGATVSGGTSGISASNTTGLTITNNGTILGNSGIAITDLSTNTGTISITNAGAISGTGNSSNTTIVMGNSSSTYDVNITNNSGGTISQTGAASAIFLYNHASSGDHITVNAGTISGSTSTAAVINVQPVTGAASTIAIAGGAVTNTAGATGLAIYVGQLNDAVNITGGAVNGTITTATAGNGSVNFNASGGFSTNGNIGVSGTAMHAVNVNGGTVTLNNAIYANTINFAGGTATVGASAITAGASTVNFGGGTLALSTHTLNIGATTLTTSTAASTLNLTIGASSNGKIVSSGAITNSLATGGQTVTINPTFSGFTAHTGDKFVVISGTASTSGLAVAAAGGGGGILQTSAQWALSGVNSGTDAYGTTISSNAVVLNYTAGGTVDAHTLAPVSNNGGNVVNAGTGTGAPSSVSSALLALTTASAVAQAGTSLSPEGNRATIDGTTTAINGVLNTVDNRLDGLRGYQSGGSGFSAGEAFDHLGLWLQGFGSAAVQGSRDGVDGYKTAGAGLALGADRLVTDAVRLGGAFSYAHTGVKNTGDTTGNSTSIASYMGTAYGSYQGKPWYVDGAVDVGYHRYQTTRLVSFSGFSDVASASHNGYQYTAKLSGGYPIDLDSVVVTPIAGVNYTHLDQDSYTETSTNGSALAVGSLSSNSFKSTLGSKIATSFDTDEVRLIPEASLAWEHEFINDSLTTQNSYAAGGGSFTTTEVRPAPDAALMGVGLTAKTTDSLSLTARYGAELRDGYVGHTGLLQARVDF